MSHGILKTVLKGLPLELEYRLHVVDDQSGLDLERRSETVVVERQEEVSSEEFACLLSMI